ncbi:hypothetical protein B0H67DRAFT_682767 [Lasiosphaeris hirsuta]|uniref:GLEYA adhesin domain-containing protein n=1 Tax=Lasiosphaeris hirsuta TaxID=260670 RepID=A0AA40AS27_9PEZI|nr:hypothetical protein B0H67DRAFT_682767 [Lasiosphaeris hirsuta]
MRFLTLCVGDVLAAVATATGHGEWPIPVREMPPRYQQCAVRVRDLLLVDYPPPNAAASIIPIFDERDPAQSESGPATSILSVYRDIPSRIINACNCLLASLSTPPTSTATVHTTAFPTAVSGPGAIGELGEDVVADCSLNLAVTVTPDAVTATELGASSTEYTTILFTVSSTVTASTETQVFGVLQGSLTTQTIVQTVQATATSVNVVWRRLASSLSSEILPAYASASCPSWKKYVAACKCIGATRTTVSLDAESTTVTEAGNTITSAVLSTTVGTETATVSVTDTTASTQTDITSVTETTLTTKTSVLVQTTTIVSTQTPLTTEQASLQTNDVAAFRALATDAGFPLYLWANLPNGQSGGLYWQSGSSSSSPSAANKYFFVVDSAGRLSLAYNIPPYTYTYAVYVDDGSTGTSSKWPQVDISSYVDNLVSTGQGSYVYAGVDPVSKELYLNGAGRKNILFCGTQVWLSGGSGSDIDTGVSCTPFHPKLA